MCLFIVLGRNGVTHTSAHPKPFVAAAASEMSTNEERDREKRIWFIKIRSPCPIELKSIARCCVCTGIQFEYCECVVCCEWCDKESHAQIYAYSDQCVQCSLTLCRLYVVSLSMCVCVFVSLNVVVPWTGTHIDTFFSFASFILLFPRVFRSSSQSTQRTRTTIRPIHSFQAISVSL